MEVKINKEIRLYFLLRPQFGTETLSWMCILGDSSFAMMGFIKYNGMRLEQFVWAWIKSEFLMPKKIPPRQSLLRSNEVDP